MSIRPYRPRDEAAVAEVWHRAGRAAYSFLPAWQTFTQEQAAVAFRRDLLPGHDIWVAEDLGGSGPGGDDPGRIVGFLSRKGRTIDRLYVDPDAQRAGWGSRLLDQARSLSPDGLELYTHQRNESARVFYEQRAFLAVDFGVSPPPESEPDVTYTWRPHPEGESAIRPATPADARFLPGVERSAATMYLPHAEELGIARAQLAETFPADGFRDAARENRLWIAVNRADVPVGFALCREVDGWAHIDEFDIHPTYGRRGTGGALLRATCRALHSRGLRGPTLCTFRDTPWTVPFYRKHGFRVMEQSNAPPHLVQVFRAERDRGLRTDLRVMMGRT